MRAECNGCSAAWELRLGYGLSHGLDENVINEFPAERKRELSVLLQKEGVFFSFREAVYKACHNLIAVPVLSMGSEGEILEVGNCPVCGGADLQTGGANGTSCPRCGKGKIETRETGRWD